MLEDMLTRLRGQGVQGVFATVGRRGGPFCWISDSSVDVVDLVCRLLEVSAQCAAFVAAYCAWDEDVGGRAEDSEGCRPFSAVFDAGNLDLDGNLPEGSGQARKAEIGKNCEFCRLVAAPLEEV